MLTLVLTLSSLLEVYTDFFSFLFSLSAAVASRQLMRWQMSTGRVETTCCMVEKKACSNKGRKIHNNKKPVKERENEGTSLDTVTEAFKVFFFQNKGCCVQPPLPLLIPAAPSVVPAQVLCDCELNQIKALIQGKKKQQHHQKQTGKERQKERKLQSSCYCCQKRCQASHSLARPLRAWGCRADRWAMVPWDLQPGQTVKTHRPVLPQAAAEFDL